MVSWRETRVDDDAALGLLAEYFSSRAQSFPGSQGEYQTVFPSADQFVPPRGVFLVVEGEDLSGEPADVGCGGIRRVELNNDTLVTFEVKHLWLQPHVRRFGYGRALMTELERRAVAFGAQQLVLDTNASLAAAAELYRTTGFLEVPPYNDNPNANHWYAKGL